LWPNGHARPASDSRTRNARTGHGRSALPCCDRRHASGRRPCCPRAATTELRKRARRAHDAFEPLHPLHMGRTRAVRSIDLSKFGSCIRCGRFGLAASCWRCRARARRTDWPRHALRRGSHRRECPGTARDTMRRWLVGPATLPPAEGGTLRIARGSHGRRLQYSILVRRNKLMDSPAASDPYAGRDPVALCSMLSPPTCGPKT
jgi:hypothetical protein